jgi:hypothetical protein
MEEDAMEQMAEEAGHETDHRQGQHGDKDSMAMATTKK